MIDSPQPASIDSRAAVWHATAALSGLSPRARDELARIVPLALPRGAAVFRPGDSAQAFPVVISGRIDVFLTGPTGRDILLYSVEPGQSCVQTTLGLLGGEDYSGEGVAGTDCTLVPIPRGLFLRLMDGEPAFRSFVFAAFAQRMKSMVHVLEKVAFQRVESRLAEALIALADDRVVSATQAELAARIGSAREVVSRRLDSFARRGWVETDRGQVRLTDLPALRRLAATDGPA